MSTTRVPGKTTALQHDFSSFTSSSYRSNLMRDRIMSIESFQNHQVGWKLNQTVVAEACSDGATSQEYFLSLLLHGDPSRQLELDFGAGQFRRPTRSGTLVFADISLPQILKGIGPFHSIALTVSRDWMHDRICQLTDGRLPSLEVLSSRAFEDQTIEVLLKEFVVKCRQPAHYGQKESIEEIMTGICRGLVRLADPKMKLPPIETKAYRMIQGVLQYMKIHLHEDLSLESLAVVAGISPAYLSRQFTKAMGVTLKSHLTALRIESVRQLLVDEPRNTTISEIATRCGFYNTSHLCSVFRREFGTTPEVYRQHLFEQPVSSGFTV